HYHHEQPADGYGWGQLQEDMANMSKNQTEFYDIMLAQQAAYGLRLQEMETKVNLELLDPRGASTPDNLNRK
ncbi:hypothetical protein PIB30_108842, partial [Stylosanthes scabra]|nr:hypothetical protein [Stylosanthes scabra]